MIHKAKIILLSSFFIIPILFVGCSSFPKVTETDWQNVQVRDPEITSDRYKRIIVIHNHNWSSFRDAFMEKLISSGCYDVVTRDRLRMILKEQNLQYSGRFDLETAVAWGKLLGANAIFEISDVRFVEEDSPVFGSNWMGFGDIYGYGWYVIRGYDVEKGSYVLYKRSSRITLPKSGFGLSGHALTHFLKHKIVHKGGKIVGIKLYRCY